MKTACSAAHLLLHMDGALLGAGSQQHLMTMTCSLPTRSSRPSGSHTEGKDKQGAKWTGWGAERSPARLRAEVASSRKDQVSLARGGDWGERQPRTEAPRRRERAWSVHNSSVSSLGARAQTSAEMREFRCVGAGPFCDKLLLKCPGTQ